MPMFECTKFPFELIQESINWDFPEGNSMEDIKKIDEKAKVELEWCCKGNQMNCIQESRYRN